MAELLGQGRTLTLVLVLLPLVASLPAVASKVKVRAAMAAYLLALLCCSLGVWQAFEHGNVLVDSFPSKIVRYATRELNEASEPNVLVIDGGSYVQNGVDSATLMRELAALGYPARVVRLAVGGANHFERFRMQQGIVRRLAHPPRRGQQWLYLSEVHIRYDRVPLDQFEKNQDTERTIDYCSPGNAWAAARTLATPGIEAPFDGAYRWPLFRHVLLNAFSVGASSRYVPEVELEVGGGNVNGHRGAFFWWRGLGSSLQALQRPAPKIDPLPWLSSIRDVREQQLWGGYVSRFLYLGLPSTSPAQLDYVRGFCARSSAPCIAPDDPQLLAALDNRNYWRDDAHMLKPGAILYSRWLAHRLAALGVLRH